jgi:FdhE protein
MIKEKPMASYLALTSLQVKKAVESVRKNKPVYAEILDFYGQVFDAQEDCKVRIRLKPIHISEKRLSVKAREKLPLIDVDCFVYDENESVNLFMTICNLAKTTNSKLAASAEVIMNAAKGTIKPPELLSGFLDGNEALFENIAVELEIEKQIIGFITYNSLKPSLFLCADQLAVYLNNSDPWLKGYCPICGNAPILSILEQEGRRKLVCSFCWQVWSAKRVYCPYCDSSQNKDRHYFYSEEEKEARVDLCDHCKKYIKTIDTRKVDRLIYPSLEHISNLHLDIKAQEMGFAPGIELFVQI